MIRLGILFSCLMSLGHTAYGQVITVDSLNVDAVLEAQMASVKKNRTVIEGLEKPNDVAGIFYSCTQSSTNPREVLLTGTPFALGLPFKLQIDGLLEPQVSRAVVNRRGSIAGIGIAAEASMRHLISTRVYEEFRVESESLGPENQNLAERLLRDAGMKPGDGYCYVRSASIYVAEKRAARESRARGEGTFYLTGNVSFGLDTEWKDQQRFVVAQIERRQIRTSSSDKSAATLSTDVVVQGGVSRAPTENELETGRKLVDAFRLKESLPTDIAGQQRILEQLRAPTSTILDRDVSSRGYLNLSAEDVAKIRSSIQVPVN